MMGFMSVSVHQNALKRTYKRLGITKFSGGETPGPPVGGGRSRGQGRGGRGGEEGGEKGKGEPRGRGREGGKGRGRGRGGARLTRDGEWGRREKGRGEGWEGGGRGRGGIKMCPVFSRFNVGNPRPEKLIDNVKRPGVIEPGSLAC